MKNEKPLNKKSYGHIPHLPGSRLGPGDYKIGEGQTKIATEKVRQWNETVIVTEKLDGSNCCVANIDGKIIPLTRAGYTANTSPFKQHHYFHDWVILNEERFLRILLPGERACGEWMIQAHGSQYKLDTEPFFVFDMMKGIDRIPYKELVRRCFRANINMPQLISYGPAVSIDWAIRRLKKSGHGCLGPVEGAVWKVETEGKFNFICKYVRPEKEDGIFLEDGKTVWNDFPDKENILGQESIE